MLGKLHRTSIASRRAIFGIFRAPHFEVRHFHILDALRGVAAIAILIWHYQHFFAEGQAQAGTRGAHPLYRILWPFYEGGGVAVQFFWIISGFVFAAVYSGRMPSGRSFFINRFARLYPLHLVTLTVVAVLQFVSVRELGRSLIYGPNDLYHFALNLLFVSGWGFDQAKSFNGPIWSVSLEILVYAAFWLSLRFLFKVGMVLPALIALMCLGLFTAAPRLLVFDCAFDFFAGCTVYTVYRGLPRWASLGCGLGLAAVSLGVWHMLHAQGLATVIMFNAIVLLAAVAEDYRFAKSFARFQWFGNCTYGTYLWHVPVQILTLIIVSKLALPRTIFESPWVLALFLGGVIAIARVSYVTIEAPWRRRIQHWWRASHGERNADPKYSRNLRGT
jgi:peptidoglycan/LPS O-acetylase OafA/YrhL